MSRFMLALIAGGIAAGLLMHVVVVVLTIKWEHRRVSRLP